MPPAALQPNFPRYQRSAHDQVVHLGQVPLSPRREAAYAAIMDEFDDVYDDLTSMHKVAPTASDCDLCPCAKYTTSLPRCCMEVGCCLAIMIGYIGNYYLRTPSAMHPPHQSWH